MLSILALKRGKQYFTNMYDLMEIKVIFLNDHLRTNMPTIEFNFVQNNSTWMNFDDY